MSQTSPVSRTNTVILGVLLGGAAVVVARIVLGFISSELMRSGPVEPVTAATAVSFVATLVVGVVGGGAFLVARVRGPAAPIGAAAVTFIGSQIGSLLFLLIYVPMRTGLGVDFAIDVYVRSLTHFAILPLIQLVLAPVVAGGIALLGMKARRPAGAAFPPPGQSFPPPGQPFPPGQPGGWGAPQPPYGQPQQPPPPGQYPGQPPYGPPHP